MVRSRKSKIVALMLMVFLLLEPVSLAASVFSLHTAGESAPVAAVMQEEASSEVGIQPLYAGANGADYVWSLRPTATFREGASMADPTPLTPGPRTLNVGQGATFYVEFWIDEVGPIGYSGLEAHLRFDPAVFAPDNLPNPTDRGLHVSPTLWDSMLWFGGQQWTWQPIIGGLITMAFPDQINPFIMTTQGNANVHHTGRMGAFQMIVRSDAPLGPTEITLPADPTRPTHTTFVLVTPPSQTVGLRVDGVTTHGATINVTGAPQAVNFNRGAGLANPPTVYIPGGELIGAGRVPATTGAGIPAHQTFSHWTANEDVVIDGDTYDAGEELTSEQVANVTVQAVPLTFTGHWETAQYDVSFNIIGNGAGQVTGTAPAPSRVEHGYHVPLQAVLDAYNEATPASGVTFLGWRRGTATDLLTHQQVATEANQTITSNVTFNAVWGATVTFNANGGTPAAPPVFNAELGVALGAGNIPTLANTNHVTPPGWQSSVALTTPDHPANTTITQAQLAAAVIRQPVTFTAQWTRIQHTVTFARGTTTGAPLDATIPATVTVQVNQGDPIGAANVPTWSDVNHYDVTWLPANPATHTVTEPITFTAQWTPRTQTITFDFGTWTGAPADNVAQRPQGMAIGVANVPANPNRPNHDFLGWQINGTGPNLTQAQAGAEVVGTSAITFVANYEIRTHEVTFLRGTTTGATLDASIPASVTITVNEGETIGDRVPNWSDANHYDVTWSPANPAAHPVTAPITFTAQWTPRMHDVTFARGTSTGAPIGGTNETVSVAQGTQISAARVPTWTDTNNNFTGWNATNMDNAAVGAHVVTAPITFTAQWTPITHTVRFECAVTDFTSVSHVLPQGVAIGLPNVPENLSATGRTFNGWQLSGTGTVYSRQQVADMLVATSDMTFVAAWDIVTHPVTFNFGWAGGPADVVHNLPEGEAIGLANVPEDPERENYEFDGWVLGTADPVDRATVAAMNVAAEAMTFTAAWTPITWTVRFECAVTDFTPVSHELQQGVAIGLANVPENLSATGRTFNGWQLSGTGTPLTRQQVADMLVATNDMTFVAAWDIVTHDVTFDFGGAPATIVLPLPEGEAIGLANVPADPERENYDFDGWVLGTDDPRTRAEVGAMIVEDPMTFTAAWTRIQHEVIFVLGIGGDPVNVMVNQGDAIGVSNVPDGLPIIDDYSFAGWHRAGAAPLMDNAAVGAVVITAGLSVEDRTFTAQWARIEHAVTFVLGVGGANVVVNVPQGEAIGDRVPADPTAANYTFLGWNEDPTLTREQVAAIEVTEPITFTAQWDQILQTVTFDFGDWDDAPDAVVRDLHQGNPIGAANVPAVPEREDYIFLGWQLGATGEPLTAEAVAAMNVATSAMVFTAQWEEDLGDDPTVTVTFMWNDGCDINGGIFDYAIIDEGDTVDEPTPARVDYTFVNWTTDADGEYVFDFETEIDEDIDLYAQWDVILIDGMFPDVVPGDWFAPHVLYAVNRGFMAGTGTYPNIVFAPNMAFSRAMFVAMLYNAEGQPDPISGRSWDEIAESLSDVNVGDWFGRAVLWAYDARIVGGVGGGRFDPNGPISRAMMATLMRNYAQAKGWYANFPISGDPLADFPDAAAVPDWAQGAMAWAVYNNLLSGVPVGDTLYLQPMSGAPRSQAAAIMRNFIVNIVTECDRETPEDWRYTHIASVTITPAIAQLDDEYIDLYYDEEEYAEEAEYEEPEVDAEEAIIPEEDAADDAAEETDEE